MKIAIFTDTFFPFISGVSATVFNQANELAKRGHKVMIVYPNGSKMDVEGLHKNIHLYRMPFSIKYPPLEDFYIGLPLIFPVLKRVKEFNPDIIHTHSEFGAGITGRVLGKILKKPVIGTAHTMLTEDEYLKNFHIPPTNLTRKGMGKYLADFYKKCDAVITPSKSIGNELKKHGLLKKPYHISNGIEDVTVPRNIKGLRKRYHVNDGINLIYVGRVYREKSLDMVLKAFSKISSKNGETKLIIIGGGPKLKDLKKLANDLGVSKKVLFTGFIDRYEIMKEDLFNLGAALLDQGKIPFIDKDGDFFVLGDRF